MARGIQLNTNASAVNSISFAIAPKAIEKQLKKAAKTSESGKATFGYHRPDINDGSGRGLWTLTHAALTVLGGMSVQRNQFDPKAWAAFYRSDTAVRYHTKAGHVERTGGNMARLTVAGWNYLYGRLTGATQGQRIYQEEIDAFAAAIKTGKAEGYATRHTWVAF